MRHRAAPNSRRGLSPAPFSPCRYHQGGRPIVAWITDPVVIERIVTHRKRAGLESPFYARGPPDA